jgi:hypothetical protein
MFELLYIFLELDKFRFLTNVSEKYMLLRIVPFYFKQEPSTRQTIRISGHQLLFSDRKTIMYCFKLSISVTLSWASALYY